MTQRSEGAVEGDRFTLSEAARLLGVCRQSLYDWLKRHELLRRCPREGKYRYVNVGVLERYRAATEAPGVDRVPRKPPSWVAMGRAADCVGCHPSFIYRAVERGEVKVARVGHIHYYCPEDLTDLRLRLRNTPLPGWVEIGPCAEAHGVARTAVTAWLRRNGYEIRLYRRSEDRRRVACTLQTALDAWRAVSMSGKKERVQRSWPDISKGPDE